MEIHPPPLWKPLPKPNPHTLFIFNTPFFHTYGNCGKLPRKSTFLLPFFNLAATPPESFFVSKAGKPSHHSEKIKDSALTIIFCCFCCSGKIKAIQNRLCGNPSCFSIAIPLPKQNFPYGFSSAEKAKRTFPRFPHPLLLLLSIYTTTTYCRFGGSRHEV